MSTPKPAVDSTVQSPGVPKVTPDTTVQSQSATTIETNPGIDTGFVPFTNADRALLYSTASSVAPLAVPTATTLAQKTWFIDPINGNDASSGATAPTALKTFRQLAQRYGTGGVIQGGGDVVVTIMSSLPATDPIENLNVTLTDPTGSTNFVIQGQTTQVRAGTLGAVTALNRATNTPWSTVDSIGTPFTVQERVRITGGGNAGAVFWIMKQVAPAPHVRFSQPAILDIAGTQAVVESAVTGGDPYVVETLPTVTVGLNSVQSTNEICNLVYQDLDFGPSPYAVTLFNNEVFSATIVAQCSFWQSTIALGSTQQEGLYFLNCGFSYLISGNGPVAIFAGCLIGIGYIATEGPGATISVAMDFQIQEGSISSNGFQSGSIIITSVGIWDSSTDAISVGINPTDSRGTGGSLAFGNFFTGAGVHSPIPSIYGNNNAGVGLRLWGGVQCIYDPAFLANITITGTGGDFRVGQSALALTTARADTFAPITVNQTWTNLAAAYAAGFNGTAINYTNLAGIVPAH